MRGAPDPQLAMLTTLSTEELIPVAHPIRRIRRIVEDVLIELDGEFDAMYSTKGRRSVPPEALLKATILMALYSIRSERAFCERLNYDLLFKWFLDLPIDAKAFDPTTFTKNRKRLLDQAIADRFFEAVVRQAQLRRYVSSEHFSVDGSLLEAWASHKSFKPNDTPPSDGDDDDVRPPGRNTEVDWRGQKRSNTTHTSTTDPDARLARKSMNTAARLCDRLDMNSVRSVCSTRSITSFCTASIFSMRPTTSSAMSSGRIASTRAACSDLSFDSTTAMVCGYSFFR